MVKIYESGLSFVDAKNRLACLTEVLELRTQCESQRPQTQRSPFQACVEHWPGSGRAASI